MRVYQTYINMMNEHIRDAHAAGTNPWDFDHVKNLDFGRGGATALSEWDDTRPMVVMASPGMMQSGFSRELFETWCSDRRNGLMMPGCEWRHRRVIQPRSSALLKCPAEA